MKKGKKKIPYTEEFEEGMWKPWPWRWNRDSGLFVKRRKRPAFEAWVKLSPEIRNECLTKVKYVKKAEGGAVRDLVTWLNQSGWEDIELPEEKPQPLPITPEMKQVPSAKPESISDKVNRQKKLLRRN